MTIVKKLDGKTLGGNAQEYVALVCGPVNGFGQCIHTKYGQSHNYLRAMDQVFGRIETESAITNAFAIRADWVLVQS
jgi:hypothetical protein